MHIRLIIFRINGCLGPPPLVVVNSFICNYARLRICYSSAFTFQYSIRIISICFRRPVTFRLTFPNYMPIFIFIKMTRGTIILFNQITAWVIFVPGIIGCNTHICKMCQKIFCVLIIAQFHQKIIGFIFIFWFPWFQQLNSTIILSGTLHVRNRIFSRLNLLCTILIAIKCGKCRNCFFILLVIHKCQSILIGICLLNHAGNDNRSNNNKCQSRDDNSSYFANLFSYLSFFNFCFRCFFLCLFPFSNQPLFLVFFQDIQINVPQVASGLSARMARLFLPAIHSPADAIPQIFLLQKEIFSPTSVFYPELFNHFAVQPGSQSFRVFQCFPCCVIGIPNRIVREYNFCYHSTERTRCYIRHKNSGFAAKICISGAVQIQILVTNGLS